MRVGKPYLRVIKNAFGFTTREARDFLFHCEHNLSIAVGIAGEYNKKAVVAPLFKMLHPKKVALEPHVYGFPRIE